MRFFISVSYNGSNYNGWQKQKNGASVQQHLEYAFSVYLKEEVGIVGAGRTDTGVHAMEYIAHFDSANLELSKERQMIIYKINAILPTDIVFHDICQVHENAHSRFDAMERSYKYFIHTFKDPFAGMFSFFTPKFLDISAMNKAAEYLIGNKDFTSMAKLHSPTKTNICNVKNAFWSLGSPISQEISNNSFKTNGNHYVFEITANRFLRNMVRAITGTLLEIGQGKHDPEWILEVLEKKERGAAGTSVPAHALFLTKIEYPYQIFTHKNI